MVDHTTIDQKKMLERIKNTYYIDRDDSFRVLSYLVSKIEKEPYSVAIKKIHFQLSDSGVINPYCYAYLVADRKKKEAYQEVQLMQQKVETQEYLQDSFLSIVQPSDDLVALGYYKESDGKQIRYCEGNSSLITMSPVEHPDIQICDQHYHYILDYMNGLVAYRLETGRFDGISLDEMFSLADDFVRQYDKNKQKTLSVS